MGCCGRLQFSEVFHAVAVWKLHIKHDQIEEALMQGGAAFGQRGGDYADETASFESCFQVHANCQTVIDYQHT
jgi:hypothetical protein